MEEFYVHLAIGYEMGIWPWSDVFKSGEINNMIVSVLSAGAVGTGDKLGSENKANILMACRTDGVLVKPDVPLQPMDKDYIQIARGENQPLLGYTYTRHGDIRTGYVFAFTDDSTTSTKFSFKPADIGITCATAVFDPLRKTLQIVEQGKAFISALPESRYVYYIIAPITGSGIAFLGDGGKIVSTGKKRIANLISAAKKLQVKVVFAKDESTITLRGYGTHEVVSDKGKISWDSKTHLFTLTLHSQPGENSVIVNFREK